MTPERWQKLQELCHLALEREPSKRAAFLAEACRDDAELRREAESLISNATISAATLNDPPDELAPKVIGHYHLLQKIGEGGMGEVWLAEQKEPVRRRVALKLVKAGMNTREVMARFESERQALALMEHPAIAKVYDAGSTSQGAPYFVMEYVAGVPITEYCDNHQLSIKERLELFMQVCEGVRHAHQKAVIHRDLKPSNILVMEVDERAAPKIIDFGVAKALSQKLTLHTIFTSVGSLVGTPEYMSPEQALSSGEDVDTRTDVYSLGIIFYELLAGAPPIELRRVAFDEYLRRLREEDPPKPSTKVRTQDAATSSELARRRQTEPATLMKQIGGDLDSIALKALEKDRSRRYGSAGDFAADIARYLRHEAVLAVPPSAGYRARKFANRHRWGLVMSCAFAVVLTAAAVISIRQSLRANREAAVAEAVNDFLRNDLLAQASAATQSGPTTKPDPDLKVRTALDRAAAKIGGKFDRQPEVEAAIRDTIGRTYLDLGLYPEARKQLERALELYRRVWGSKNPKTLGALRGVGRAVYLQGQYPEAAALLSQALETQQQVLGPEHPDTLSLMHLLANTYYEQGKYAQSEASHKHILEVRQRVLGPEHRDTLASIRSLALVYYLEGKYDDSIALLTPLLETERRVLGPEHPDTLNSMNNLAMDYSQQRDYARAEALFSRTLEIRLRILGPEHSATLSSMHNLANLYLREGKYSQAEPLFTQTLETQRKILGSSHASTLMSMETLANTYASLNKYANAEALFAQTLEIQQRVLGPEHPDTLVTLSDFAFMYLREGKYSQAETYAVQALAAKRHTLGSDNADTMDSAGDLGLAYVSQGKFVESEPLAREVFTFFAKNQPDGWVRFRTESLLGASLAGLKKYAEAEPLLTEGYQGLVARKDRMSITDGYYRDRAHEWLMQLYRALGKREKLEEWSKKSS
jgi:serine/threonine protein kinase/tetratricopeptide (TPR) repeat protein